MLPGLHFTPPPHYNYFVTQTQVCGKIKRKLGSSSKSYTCWIHCRTTPRIKVKPGQKNPAHNRGETGHGGDDEIAGSGGILSGPRVVLRRQEAAENPIKVLGGTPPPAEKGCGLLSASSTAATSGLQLAPIFGEHAPPTHKPVHRPPLLPSAPRVQEQVGLVLSFRQRAPRGGAEIATTQNPRPGSPPPPPARASCHVAQGPGPDTAALGLGEDRTNDRLPADPRSGFAHLGPEPITRGRSLSFSSQSDAEGQAGGG